VFQTVLVGAKICSLLVDFLERFVDDSNGTVSAVRCGQRQDGFVTNVSDAKALGSHGSDKHLNPLIHVGTNVEPHRGGNHVFADKASEPSGKQIHTVELCV